jgi:peptidoglycan/LPS O-acetylase OafA/YrhL
MSGQPSQRFVALDGVRGVAALLVMGLHIAACLGSGLLGHGYLMVDLFFLMSGFVLSAGYGARLAEGGQGRWFAGKRLIRLYPLALIGLLLGLGVAAGLSAMGTRPLEAHPGLLFVLGAAFLPWLAGGLISPFNGPAWSLQLELWINLAYGFVARWLTDQRLIALVAVAALMLVASTVAFGQFDNGFASNDATRSAGPWSYLGGWARVGFAFPAGILLHRLWSAGRLGAFAARSTGWLLPVLLLLVALPPMGLPPVFDLAVVLLLFPAAVSLAANARVEGWTGRLFEGLGRLSYGLYVLHGPILVAFKALEPAGLALPLRLGWYGLAALLAMAAAALAERWIDRPVRRWAAGADIGRTRPDNARPTAATATVQLPSG